MKTITVMSGGLAALLLLFGAVRPANAATVNAASCSRSDVDTAITNAAYGDNVAVPAGACTWSTVLTITKGITLQGAGAASTTITSGVGASSYLLVYNPDANSISADRPFRLTGFTFDMNNVSGGIHVMSNSPNVPMTKLQIYGNVFKNTTGNGTSSDVACLQVGEPGQIYGVVYSNTFTNCKTTTENYGGYENSWNNFSLTFGGADNLYYEDNTFSGNSAFFYGGHGGRYVARFNTINFNSTTYEVVWDIHGNQPNGVYATMGCEIYRNTVTTNHGTAMLDDRGGKCMIFDNTITGPGDWQVREEYDDSIDPETNTQPQHVSDTYYFLNMQNGGNVTVNELSDCCAAIAPNAQYWNYAPAFTGASGVGSGTLANRPTTCTIGVGYWATNQGSWNATGASGQFYKCTAANTWSLYYTPLAHPHPLRSGAPSAPTNLKITGQ